MSPGALSFKVEDNEFNETSIDSDPQTVTVTNTGTAPLSISAAKIVNSAGGFVIDNRCVSILVNDAYTTPCATPPGPADTCTGATLSPGASCAVAVEYADAGLYPSPSGSLEIDSNSPTSPDLVSLSGTSTFISAIQGGAVPGGCPGVIPDTESADPNTSAGSGIGLGGCWISPGPGSGAVNPGPNWGAVGPVTIDGDVTLSPTSSNDELWVSPSFAGGTANDTIFATPSNASYDVMVAPPAASDPAAGATATTSGTAGPNTEALGVVDLGENPFTCSHPWEDALAPGYIGCQSVLAFQADSPADTIHGLPVTGGEITFGGCPIPLSASASSANAVVSANAALPSLFSSSPVAGSSPPTATFFFGTCSPPASAGSSSPPPPSVGGSGSSCGLPRCTGRIIPIAPSIRLAGPGAAGEHAGLRRALSASDDNSSCPSGDVDYSASAPESFVGAMDFGSPYLCYDPTRDVWTVGGTVGILNANVDTGPPPDYGIGFHSDGTFDHGGIQSVNFNPGLPLAPAVNLTSFGGSFGLDPTTLQANATVSVAGVLQIAGGAFAVWANQSHPYTYQPFAIPGVAALQTDTAADPLTDFAAGIGGNVSLDVPVLGTIQLASGYVFYAAPSYFEFAGCLGDCNNGLSFLNGLIKVTGNVQGALDTGDGQYNIGGTASVCADFPHFGNVCLPSFTVDVSNKGLGACLTEGPFTVGVIVSSSQGIQIVGPFSCDLSSVTVVVQRDNSVDQMASIARANRAVTLNLTGHPPSTSIYVKGIGGTPVLSLAGPHGQRLSESSDRQGVLDRRLGLVIWPEPKLGETLVAIDHPTPGAWTLTPLPGSTAISNVAYANAIAPARITATISGRGRAYTVSCRVRPRPGQRVTFVERAGRVFHVLGVARGTHGELRFSSGLGPAGRREIVAEISLSGMPTPPLVVGQYLAPPPPRAGKPARLTLARRGRALAIQWAPAANAHSYLCVVSLSDGRRAAYVLPARQRSMIVPTGCSGRHRAHLDHPDHGDGRSRAGHQRPPFTDRISGRGNAPHDHPRPQDDHRLLE
ncbi:MAG: hypothetical protein ACLP01_13945 [Solirubrobacteraceae bacterium]